MSTGAFIAAACLVTLAVLHSYLGERSLIGPLLRSPNFPALPIREEFAKNTLRFAWHLTSFAWLSIAYMFARGECSAWPVAAFLAGSGVVTHVATRGRHAAWAVFSLGALAAASTAWDGSLWPRFAAAFAAVAFAAIGCMHVVWACGIGWGTGGAVPESRGKPLFKPPPVLTLLVALGLFVAAWLVLALAQFVPAPVPASWLWFAGVAAAVVFGARTIGDGRFVGLFKRVRGTRFARLDDVVFTPLCFALCAALVLQLV